ncbi:two-component system regulatory protein YycI [Paenibacillus humicola]|uniref:two-component system regulatory protein YycI n=1 Tax=Paenibacillus humicola TaxID=3110540 RepID=UPI00237B6E6B|nr:two-component system regulatory protein YycI [Paenibacillus humicola]
MDWSRAKSVLIIAFLLLNVVLGYQLWSNIREGLSASGDVSDMPPETLAIMQKKNIRLDTSIPLETPDLRDLTYRVTDRLGAAQRIELKQPVDSKIVFNGELQHELGSIIPNLDQYSFVDTNWGGEFILYRKAGSLPIFDAKLELYYNGNQKITAYRQDQIELVSTEEGPKQTVLSATKAVTRLIENYLPDGAVIREIKLGYQGQIFSNSETQVAAPSWRVLLEDGAVYYVNAISAEVVKDKESVS